MNVLLVLTNAPDRQTADSLAAEIVERRLAACVSNAHGLGNVRAGFWACAHNAILALQHHAYALRQKRRHQCRQADAKVHHVAVAQQRERAAAERAITRAAMMTGAARGR